MAFLRASSVLVLLALAGCDVFGPAPVDAALAAEPRADDVLLRVTNTGEATIEFGALPCSVDLEVLRDGEWEPSPYEPLIGCLGVQTRLDPGESDEAAYPTAGVPPGTYRFRLLVRGSGGAAESVVSNDVSR